MYRNIYLIEVVFIFFFLELFINERGKIKIYQLVIVSYELFRGIGNLVKFEVFIIIYKFLFCKKILDLIYILDLNIIYVL